MRLHPIVTAALVLTAAAAVAAGCSGDDAATGPTGTSAGASGAGLEWVADDAVVIGTFDVQSGDVEVALETLGRLPVWNLVEVALPKGDTKDLYGRGVEGSGLFGELEFEEDIDPWFTGRGGVAIGADAADTTEGGDMPFVAWFESEDDDAALKAWRRGAPDGALDEREHDGTSYVTRTDDGGDGLSALADDGVLVVGTEAALENAIETHESGEDVTSDDDLVAVLGAVQDGMLVAGAVRTPQLVELGAAAMGTRDEAMSDPRHAQVASRAATFLASRELDAVLPDVVGAGATLDGVGLRVRGAWSNPSELASSDASGRDLVERLPASVVSAVGTTADPAGADRMFDLLDRALEDFEVDGEQLASACDPELRPWCDVAAAILGVLADADARDALTAGAPRSVAFGTELDMAAAIELGSQSALVAPGTEHAPTKVPAITSPTGPISSYYHLAEQADEDEAEAVRELLADPELVRSLRAAGVDFRATEATITLRVLPGTPLARSLATIPPAEAAAFAATGIDLVSLRTGHPITLTIHEHDDLDWVAFPEEAASPMRAAIEEGDDTLGESARYLATLAAADAPDDAGMWTWTDYAVLAEDLSMFGEEATRAQPLVDANLAHVGGLVGWTTRARSADREVGVYESVLPILEDEIDDDTTEDDS